MSIAKSADRKWLLNAWDVLRRIVTAMGIVQVSSLAAEIAYYLLLSFFPFLIFLISLLGQVAKPYQAKLLAELHNALPEPVHLVVAQILNEIMRNPSLTLMSFSMVGMIWAASRGFAVILRGLNQAYGNWHPRPFTNLILRGFGLLATILLSVAIILTLTLITLGSAILAQLSRWFDLPFLSGRWLFFLRYLFTFTMLFAVFSVLYYLISQARDRKHWRYWQTLPGAAFAALAWLLLSWGFSFYIGSFDRYANIYGSLGGLVILMLWLYLCSTLVLTGGIVNAELFSGKHRTIQSTEPIPS